MTDSIGTRIGQLRGRLSQKQLANALGVSRSLVKAWENNERKITTEHLLELSRYFNVSCDYLLGLTSKDNSTNNERLRMVSEYTGLGNNAIQAIKAHSCAANEISEVLSQDAFYDIIENLKDLSSAYNRCVADKSRVQSLDNGKEKEKEIDDLISSFTDLKAEYSELDFRWKYFVDIFFTEQTPIETINECKRLLKEHENKA